MIHEFSDCHFPFPIICAILAPGLLFYRPKFIWSVPNMSIWGKIKRGIIETLPKAQRTRGLSSYHKLHTNLDQISYFRISNRYQFQNLNQRWTYRLKLNLEILTKPSFRISTKIQLHNLYKTSAAKCWTNSSSQINKLLPRWSSVSTSARVTISTSFELVSSHARVTSNKSTKRHGVRGGSQWRGLPMIGLGSDRKSVFICFSGVIK